MGKFLTHESIAAGCWNYDYSCAAPSLQQWHEILMNHEDFLLLAIDRMASDWLALKPSMRKAYSQRDVEPGTKRCEVFV